MKLSTKGRYGVKAMVELAIHYGDSPLSIKKLFHKGSNIWILLRTVISPICESKSL